MECLDPRDISSPTQIQHCSDITCQYGMGTLSLMIFSSGENTADVVRRVRPGRMFGNSAFSFSSFLKQGKQLMEIVSDFQRKVCNKNIVAS